MSNVDTIIAEIQEQHRRRNFFIAQRTRGYLALGAYVRTMHGWHLGLPANERKIIEETARMIVDGELDSSLRLEVLLTKDALKPFEAAEASATKQMEKLVKQLPVWDAWGKGVRGFGARSLAVIVGEAGDLSNYATHSKLWKRMGLAVMGDVRQGGLAKTAAKADWIAHGYNAKRRAYMFVIGDVMVKQGEFYRQVYLDRKQYEIDIAVSSGLIVLPSAKIPAALKEYHISQGHIHKRAQRYMEKKLLRDLWREWRKALGGVPIEARSRLPSDISLPEQAAA